MRVLLALAAMLVLPSTALADTWAPPATVPRSTSSSVPTQGFVDSAGRASVVARGSYGGKSQILRTVQLGSGDYPRFGRAFSGTATQSATDFAFNARGDGVMIGLSARSNVSARVALRATRRPGSTMGPRQEYSAGEGQAQSLRIAISDRGDALATWVVRRRGRFRIAYVMRPAGHRFGARRLLSFVAPSVYRIAARLQPVPAVDAQGRIGLIFGDGGGRLRIATGFLSRGFTATQDVGFGISTTTALDLEQGRGVASWWDTSIGTPRLQTVRRERGQAAFSAPIVLPGSGGPGVLGPLRVAVLGDGAAVVAAVVAGERAAAWRAAPSNPFGAAELVSRAGPTAYAPSLAAAPDGGAVLAFSSVNGTNNRTVEATVLTAGEQRFGPATVVAPVQRDLGGPVAAAGPGGRAAVVFNENVVRVSRLVG